jgi:t-SNARE complex subunit (syntaxin)
MRSKEEMEKSLETVQDIEKETDNFIAEHLKLFKEMWERERAVDELNVNVEKLNARSSAFGRSIKKANKKLRSKYMRNMLAIVAVLMLLIVIFKVTRNA